MPSYLSIEILGVKQVQRQLFRGAERAGNMRPALWKVREDMFRVIRMTFQSQGRRGGGSWKQLDPETVARKIREGRDPKILYATHHLVDSLTVRGNRYMRSKVTRHDITLDTTLPYADTQQHGDESRGIVARPFIHFTLRDRVRWVKMCEESLMAAMRG